MIEHSSTTETPDHEPGLSRQLGLTTATALVVAEVIGVGIFLTTTGMVKSLGSPSWLLTVWLTTGVAAAGGAICFGALAARRPEAGAFYERATTRGAARQLNSSHGQSGRSMCA